MPHSRVFKREAANAAKLDSLDNLTWYFQVWVVFVLPKSVVSVSWHQFVCDHLIREEFVLRSFSKHCAGTSPKQLAFWINNLTNPLPFKYSMLTRLSNDLEASRRSTKRPILLATTLVTRLSEYVSKRFESCTCRRRKQSLTRKRHQVLILLPEKRKLKKFLCSRMGGNICLGECLRKDCRNNEMHEPTRRLSSAC